MRTEPQWPQNFAEITLLKAPQWLHCHPISDILLLVVLFIISQLSLAYRHFYKFSLNKKYSIRANVLNFFLDCQVTTHTSYARNDVKTWYLAEAVLKLEIWWKFVFICLKPTYCHKRIAFRAKAHTLYFLWQMCRQLAQFNLDLKISFSTASRNDVKSLNNVCNL